MHFKDKILQRLFVLGEKRVVHSSSIECPPFYCFSHFLEKENERYIADLSILLLMLSVMIL